MTEAKRDENGISIILATSDADGVTPIPVRANPTSHTIDMSDGSTGSDLSGDDAVRDHNGVTVMMALSSSDGITPVLLYADAATGAILVKST